MNFRKIFFAILLVASLFFGSNALATCVSDFTTCTQDVATWFNTAGEGTPFKPSATVRDLMLKDCQDKMMLCQQGKINKSGLLKSEQSLGSLGYSGDKPQSLVEIIGNLVRVVLTIVGLLFLVLTVYGGYIWFMARGEESEAKKAQGIIKMAVIGLIVVLSAYAISYFVFAKLVNVSGVST